MLHLLASLLLTAAPVAPWRGRDTVQVDIGFASSVGEIGLTYERDLFRALSVELGVGEGLSGVQLGGMARLFPGQDHMFFVGAGPSLGLGPGLAHQSIPWVNVDLGGIESRLASGLVISASLGFATSLATGTISDSDLGDYNLHGYTIFQFRFGVGGWF